MEELEETACHFDNLREMMAVMKDNAVDNLLQDVMKLYKELLCELESVHAIKLSAINGLEEFILGKGHVLDTKRFFQSAMVRSLLNFRYETRKTFTSACFGSVVACEASAGNMKFVENYQRKMYEEGSHVVIYYMCELEHDPSLIKFIKVSVKDQGGKRVNVSNHDLMNGVYMITFAANGPGIYDIRVALSNQDVNGSPFTILVQGGKSTVPKAPLMMNDLGSNAPHVRHGRLAVDGTNPTSTSIVASLGKPTQALAKGFSVPSDGSEKHREHVFLPETDNHGEKADCNMFLQSLLPFMAEQKELPEPPSFAESVAKAASCKAPAELDSGAACPQTSGPKHGSFNIQIHSSAGHALTPASNLDSLKVKIGTGIAHQQKPAPGHDKFTVEIDSCAGHALTPATKQDSLKVKIDTGAAYQQKPAPKHDKSDINVDSSASQALTPATKHNSLNVKSSTSEAHQQQSAPGHDQLNIKTDNYADHSLTTSADHDRLSVKTGAGAPHLQKSAATPWVPASKHNDFTVKVDNHVTQRKTSWIKHGIIDIKRSPGKEFVHSVSVQLDTLKSLKLAESSVENMPAGSAIQSCKPANMPPAAGAAKSTDVPPRRACALKPVGSISSRSRYSSCTAPSVSASHTNAPAYRPGSISARLVLELDSYKNINFHYPIGITSTLQGNIIVCDTGNNRVVTFDPEGRPLHEAVLTGSKEKFYRPSAVVAMEDGKYAVKDDCCIYVFSRHGEFIHTLGKGSLQKPYGLALYEKEDLLTISLGEPVPKLRCFNASGNFERSVVYGPLARGVPANSKCRFMDVYEDSIFVADLGLSRVYKTDMKGQLMSIFGTRGKEHGRMLEPSGVSGTERFLFIGDSRNNRIQAFDSEGNFIAVVQMASGLVRPSGVYVSPTDKLCVLNYLQGVAGIYRLSYS